MSDFSDELKRLRRGRGMMAPDVEGRIEGVLRARAGVIEADGPRSVRERVSAYLTDLAGTLPEDLGLVFTVGIGLHPEARFRFFEDRMDWLAAALSRNARTIRRRFDEAIRLIDIAAEASGAQLHIAASVGSRGLDYQMETYYRPLSGAPGAQAKVGYVTGDIRKVRTADVWVNPENTQMTMSRFEEHSVSAVIRYEGARRDAAGRVVDDLIADELRTLTVDTPEVAPGTALSTAAGELFRSNNVRYVIHVAAVRGEPGQGYRQVADVGRCLANALAEADRLGGADDSTHTMLVPLLGAGTGHGDAKRTLHTLLGVVLDYFAAGDGRVRSILFLAYDSKDLAACRAVLEGSPYLSAVVD